MQTLNLKVRVYLSFFCLCWFIFVIDSGGGKEDSSASDALAAGKKHKSAGGSKDGDELAAKKSKTGKLDKGKVKEKESKSSSVLQNFLQNFTEGLATALNANSSQKAWE